MRATSMLLSIPVLGGLGGCFGSPTYDLTLELPDGAVLAVGHEESTITHTPAGPNELVVTMTKHYVVERGGKLGVDDLHWIERVKKYEVQWHGPRHGLSWSMGSEEPIPERIAAVAPLPLDRKFWVLADGSIFVEEIPPPPPEEDEQDQGAAESEEEAPAPKPTLAPRHEASERELESYIAALLRAPGSEVSTGTEWSWTLDQAMRLASPVTTRAAWKFERVRGDQAVLTEKLELQESAAPVSGQYRINSLDGGGELLFDVETQRPIAYTSKFEAEVSSPSTRGTQTYQAKVKFAVR